MKRLPSPKNVPVVMHNIIKQIYQRLLLNSGNAKCLVFVVGCQRSGTTMLMECFNKDFRTKIYEESSAITGHPAYRDDKHRLKPLDEIAAIIARDRAPLIIAKPLIDSQNVSKLLQYFGGAKAIWSYRNYRDVANSILAKWGGEVPKKNLRPIFKGDIGHYWSAERVSAQTRQVIETYFAEDMSPQDAAALFWYIRNILFFDLALDQHPNVILCRYEDIVTAPARVMQNIYHFLDMSYPGDRLVRHIHPRSVNLGRQLGLSQGVEDLCADLLEKMDRVNASYSAAHSSPAELIQQF